MGGITTAFLLGLAALLPTQDGSVMVWKAVSFASPETQWTLLAAGEGIVAANRALFWVTFGLAGLFALCDCKDDDGEAAMTSSGHRGGDNNVPFDSGVQDDLRTPESKAVREQEEAAVEHHPSWERSRNFFHGIIARIGVDYYELCDWLSTKNPPLNKRPSEMDERQRQRLTDFLCGDRGLHQFLNWKEER